MLKNKLMFICISIVDIVHIFTTTDGHGSCVDEALYVGVFLLNHQMRWVVNRKNSWDSIP